MSWLSKFTRKPEIEDDFDDEPLIIHSSAPAQPAKKDDLPSFRDAARWFSRRENDKSAGARALLRHAFTPSQPVNDRARFAGRRALMESLIVAIEDQRLHFVLYGDRGIGKTSILHVLGDLARDADYLVCYISCGERMSFNDFARRIAQRIPLLFHGGYTPSAEEIEKGLTLADVLPQFDVSVSAFCEILGQISDTRVLILLDEFDRVEDEQFRRSIAEMIKHLSDDSAPAQVVIAGVAPDLSALIAQIPSIRRNVLGVLVPNMTQDEMTEMLTIAETKAGLSFDPDARELICFSSLGLPYLVGLISQRAAMIATDAGNTNVTKDDVRQGLERAHVDLSGRIAAKTLHQVEKELRAGKLPHLSKLAQSALRNGGMLSPELTQAHLRLPGSESGDNNLIEQVDGDPLERGRFVDDGASTYIWLTALTAS